ncbi:MAG: flagellar hook-length control protein FliK [Lachnospiraceae bacterium]|nr:flagellar hook-length control protein FliK [Lachnospiraceae bacterium]
MSFFSNIADLNNLLSPGSGLKTEKKTSVPLRAESSEKNSGLKSGDLVSGEVVNVDGDKVKLKLSGDRFIDAKLETGASVNKGQTMSFEVRSDSGQTSLRPLYSNLSGATPQAYQALSAAGLSPSESNISMVNAMMEEGMSVNKEALLAMLKDVSSYPSSDPASIVQLNKLGIPVNEVNIGQLENYKNLEYQILGDADELSKGISEMIKGDVNEKVNSDILSLLAGLDSDLEEGSAIKELTDQLKELSKEAPKENEGALKDTNDEMASLKDQAVKAQGDVPNLKEGDTLSGREVQSATVREGELLKEGLKADSLLSEGNMSLKDEELLGTADQAVKASEGDSSKYGSILKEMADDISALGIHNEKTDELSKGSISREDLLRLVNELLKLDKSDSKFKGLEESLSKLLSNDDFKNTIREALMDKFTINPKEISGEGSINELYKKLLSHTDKITQMLSENGKADSQLMDHAANIKNNVSFMNDLNQMMQYVQLPLKMARENAHGDLYVYTKKKNLMSKDGRVSALLHLDMENLGPMDVYVAMENTRVNTHFYMQDDETLDFILANIDILDKRLKDKGYDMHTTVTSKDIKEDKGIVDTFLENASKEGSVSRKVSKFSFDVRA